MLVGLAGRKSVGKDTGADHLVKVFGFRKDSFAAPLKDVVSIVFGVDRAALDDPSRKEVPDARGVTPRRLMQVVGTELFRKELPKHVPVGNVWVESMCHRILQNPGKVVVSDVRFEDEARLIKELGGIVLRIERDTGANDPHSSEAIDIPEYMIDGVIDNNGDLSHFYVKLYKWVHVLSDRMDRMGLSEKSDSD